MSIGNSILGVNNVTVSNLIHYDSLLQNTTDIITKGNDYFVTKCDRSLLQNGSGFLLQNVTVLLQIASVQSYISLKTLTMSLFLASGFLYTNNCWEKIYYDE